MGWRNEYLLAIKISPKGLLFIGAGMGSSAFFQNASLPASLKRKSIFLTRYPRQFEPSYDAIPATPSEK